MKAWRAGINDPSSFINKILLERLPSWPISKLGQVFFTITGGDCCLWQE